MSLDEHFLVIGAQKCGTTTLYEDLRRHPDIALAEKESSYLLARGADLGNADEYWSHFGAASSGSRISGEVSTEYAMLPRIDAVAKATRLLRSVKVIYIVRNPLDRTISHHHHLLAEGRASADIDREIRDNPDLVNFSRYATQITPWVKAFGRQNVHVIRFETYMSDRATGLAQLLDFLGLSSLAHPVTERAYNTASTKRVATGRWKSLSRSRAYRSTVRRMLNPDLRRWLMARVLPEPPPRPPGPSAKTVRHLVEALQPEVDELASVLGTERWWSLEQGDDSGSAQDQIHRDR